MTVISRFPDTTKTPVVGVSVILGTGGVAGQAQKKVLMLGNRVGGTKADSTNSDVATGEDADTYFGAGSSLARMCRRAIDEQKGALVYGGVIATVAGTGQGATLTVAGIAGADCSYEITLNGWTVSLTIPSGQTANATATALNAAIQASPYYGQMPYNALAAAPPVVTLTAKVVNLTSAFVMANIRHDTSRLVTQTITLNAAAVAAATAVDITSVLTAASTQRYDYIACSATDSTNIGKLETHLDLYAAPLAAKRGQGVCASPDTPGNQITLARAVNAYRVQILGCEMFEEQSYEIAGAWVAHRQYREASDAGTAYCHYPLQSVRRPYLETDLMTAVEIESALNGGITPCQAIGTETQIPRSITSRSQTSGGAPDYTVLDTANVTVPDACGDDIASDFATRYTIETGIAFKIMDDPTDGSSVPSFVVTANLVKADLISWLWRWHDQLRIVNPKSPTSYISQVAASRAGNRINAQCPIPVMGGAYIFDIALIQTAA